MEEIIGRRIRCKEAEVNLQWNDSIESINWDELSNLYRIAPLGNKKASDLATVFTNSMFRCFVYDGGQLIGAGRALADGIDCAYLADIAVHPDYQGRGIGKEIVERLRDLSKHHRKIILYAAPGKDQFYLKLGFKRMQTAMAIFENQAQALEAGLIAES
jgi:GNAT superfamily N-acetyltransferase